MLRSYPLPSGIDTDCIAVKSEFNKFYRDQLLIEVSMNLEQLPAWIQTTKATNLETQIIENQELHYKLALFKTWNVTPIINQTNFENENIFQGNIIGNYLCVNFMKKANPLHDIRNWVESFLRLTGLPLLFVQNLSSDTPELLNWQYQGSCELLAKRLNCDEVHLYQGLIAISNEGKQLTRLYILLARRDTLAWKISLSLLSACLPGMSEEIITTNDHVRAAAIFSSLELL